LLCLSCDSVEFFFCFFPPLSVPPPPLSEGTLSVRRRSSVSGSPSFFPVFDHTVILILERLGKPSRLIFLLDPDHDVLFGLCSSRKIPLLNSPFLFSLLLFLTLCSFFSVAPLFIDILTTNAAPRFLVSVFFLRYPV